MDNSIIRIHKRTGFVVMSNYHFKDKTISLKAKGLLSQMLSLAENWDYSIAGLAAINLEGRNAIRSAINELEKAGYVKRERVRDEKGRLRDTIYHIYEIPVNKQESSNCQRNDTQFSNDVSFAETVKKLGEVMEQ